MIAGTWFDLVLGLDLHVVAIPAPPSPVPVPTPVPMPFVGLVFDPLGFAVGSAVGMALGGGPGLVLINGLPATNCGTAVTNLLTLPHTPAPGVAFVPPPAPHNDAELFFGADHVSLGGSLAVRLGDVALSCSDPVRLPTSTVLALPKGAPVLITPPRVPDLAAMAVAGAARGLGAAVRRGGKLFRNVRRVQRRSATWERISGALRNAVDRIAPRRFRDRLKRAVCFVTGHPVDVANGRVFTSQVDFELPGPLPLVFERVYSSSLSWRDGPLGYGWSHSLDQAVWTEPGKVVYLADDGREIEFLLDGLPDGILPPGDVVYEPTNRLTLKALDALRWEIEAHDGLTHEFAPIQGAAAPTRAKLVTIRSRDKHRIELHYDARGLLESVRDSGGRLVFFEHTNRGRLKEIRLPMPREQGWVRHVSFELDRQGDLVRVLDALGNAFSFEYQGHLLVKETDRTELSFYFQYDGVGSHARCTRTWGDGGIYDHVIDHDVRNRKTLVEDSLGRSTIYQMDDLGMVVTVTDPLGKSTTYTYDPESGQMASETGPLGTTTRRDYDAHGNCVAITGPDGATTSIACDARNLPVQVIDPISGIWRYRYDDEGHLIEQRTPTGELTRYGYARGLLLWSENPAGERTSYRHDDQKNLVRVRAPNGAETLYEADHRGRLVKITDARGAVWRRDLDRIGRVLRLVSPLGHVREMAYDPEGNLVETRAGARRILFRYSGFHRLAEREQAGTRVKLEHDTEGQLVAVVNEADERYNFARDLCGRVVAETGFDGKTRRYQRDAEGRVIELRLPSGKTSALSYDAAGRVARIDHSDGTFTALSYRQDGELMAATNENGTMLFERDAMGRVLRETMGERFVESRYDGTGSRVARKTSLGHETRYQVDGDGALRSVTFGVDPRFGDFSPASLRMGGPPVRAPWRATFERDLLGNETARLLPGAIVSRWRHDEMSRPSEHRIARGNIDVSSVAYQFEAEDEITTLVEHGKGATRFTHDERAFLVGATGPDGSIQHRAVDATGNIFKSPDRHDRRYGAGGRLEEADGTRHVHDADGQLIEKRLPDGRRWLYAWNVRGELLSVTRPDGQRVQFMYDALGRRTRKELGALGTAYVWDGDDLIHEVVDGAPLVTWEFAPGTFAPLAKVEGEQRYSVVTDHLGTPETLFDAHGEIAWKARLDLYGVATEQTAITACPWRWPGQYEDPETGLYYNRFRYYDPAAGRYISQDPIQLNGGLHLYAYVSCPTDESDPYGLACYKAKLSPNGLEIGKQISEKDAINRLRNGLDVFSDTKTMARSLAKRAIQGKPMHHPPHHPGYYPHFHPAQHATRSHSFYDRQR